VTISPAPPRAAFALPWDDADQNDPVAALAAARADPCPIAYRERNA